MSKQVQNFQTRIAAHGLKVSERKHQAYKGEIVECRMTIIHEQLEATSNNKMNLLNRIQEIAQDEGFVYFLLFSSSTCIEYMVCLIKKELLEVWIRHFDESISRLESNYWYLQGEESAIKLEEDLNNFAPHRHTVRRLIANKRTTFMSLQLKNYNNAKEAYKEVLNSQVKSGLFSEGELAEQLAHAEILGL